MAGALIGSGFVVGEVVGFAIFPLTGIMLWPGAVVVPVGIVFATLIWRPAEVLFERLSTTARDNAS